MYNTRKVIIIGEQFDMIFTRWQQCHQEKAVRPLVLQEAVGEVVLAKTEGRRWKHINGEGDK
jgi:hypothetical protein